MKTTTRVKLIEEALSQEEPIECAWILSEADIDTTPVYAKYRDFTFKDLKTKAEKKDREKLPVVKKRYSDGYPEGHDEVRSWSAKEYLGKHRDWEDFLYAWNDSRIGVAVVTHTEKALFIIDADTPEEVQALSTWWKDHTGEDLPEPTVKTPGRFNEETGKWEHKKGGHWYLLMPDDLYKGVTIKTSRQGVNIPVGTSHFAIRAGNLYCAAPPTVRSDGPYRFTGDIINADEWGITESIQNALVYRPEETSSTKNYEISDIFYDDGESLLSRIQKWVESENHIAALSKAGLKEISPDCGGRCSQWKWKNSTSTRSATVHSATCTNGMTAGQVTVWSDTMAADFDVDSYSVWSAWTLVKNFFYDGHEQACIHGEGLHIERTAKSRKNEMMRKAQYNHKMKNYKSTRDKMIRKYS